MIQQLDDTGEFLRGWTRLRYECLDQAALLVTLSVFFILSSTPATAGRLFSVNTATDDLVAIDTVTGSVVTVGPIGHEMQGTDLAGHNGLVYATTQKTPGFNLDGMTLVSIDPSTGAKITSAEMLLGSSEVFAEGLTSANGELVLSFDHLSLVSVRTGVVDPLTGAISNAQFHGPDLDELGTDLSGQIIAIDGITFSGNTRQMAFFEVDRDPPGGMFIGDFLMQGALDDIVFTPFGIFSLDHLNENLYRLDLSGPPSIAEVIPLGPVALQLDGLAFIVPEPSTFTLAGLAPAGLLAFRCRRRKRA